LSLRDDDDDDETTTRRRRDDDEEKTRDLMLAVIGNIIIGLGAVSLFTATLRLTKPGKRA
jgi:hypothetical protein